ncbi:MAG TPA: STAS domain-containing protein [Actinocrinis sp.]|nr:STAS domain-containing protein [Actinocrinis sp.]
MTFASALTVTEDTATIRLAGELDARTAPDFHHSIESAARLAIQRLVIAMNELEYISSAGLRCLIFARQTLGEAVSLAVAGARPAVARTIRMAGLDQGIEMMELHDV